MMIRIRKTHRSSHPAHLNILLFFLDGIKVI